MSAREKETDLTQSSDKIPSSKKPSDNTKTPPKRIDYM